MPKNTAKLPSEEAAMRTIARELLRLETLEERGSDRLDFHEVHVGSVKDALLAAYRAGLQAAQANESRPPRDATVLRLVTSPDTDGTTK